MVSKRLSSRPLFELGVNNLATKHKDLAVRRLRASSYQGVDAYCDSPQVVRADALQWLVSQPDGSGSVLAFGLLNEPLSPVDSFLAMSFWKNGFFLPVPTCTHFSRSQMEHEYLRRLAKQLYRVIPERGLLFGCGLYPMSSRRDMRHYLERAGFIENSELSGTFHAWHNSADAARLDTRVRQPFFFTKN